MKKIAMLIAGLGIAAGAIPAASAAPQWQSIKAREVRLNARIDQGIRSGALTRPEARRLRTDLVALERLEDRYRATRPGLTLAERRDLDRRFDALSARVKIQKHDRQYRR